MVRLAHRVFVPPNLSGAALPRGSSSLVGAMVRRTSSLNHSSVRGTRGTSSLSLIQQKKYDTRVIYPLGKIERLQLCADAN